MGTSAESFTPATYALIREGARRSAEVVVPLVLAELEPRTVLDVGCGEGLWGSMFERAGCEVLGIDGPEAEPVIEHRVRDLEQPGALAEEIFDLALCLEVAEHVSEARADGFVAELCGVASTVLFSAAIPGQGGVGHVNERWPGYWVERFEAGGFACSGALRWAIWDDDRVENWYRQNLMVATRHPDALPAWFATPLAPMWPVVHPVLFEART